MITGGFEGAKAGFFDQKKVMRAVDAGTRKALSRVGAFVRTRARSSIRKAKKASAPGEPPKSKTGLLRRFILFKYDFASRSVVVGPTLLPSGSMVDPLNDKTVPQVLEEGDAVVPRLVTLLGASKPAATRRQAEAYRRLVRAGRLTPKEVVKDVVHFRYEARPYMRPALLAEVSAGTIPAAFKNSVTG